MIRSKSGPSQSKEHKEALEYIKRSSVKRVTGEVSPAHHRKLKRYLMEREISVGKWIEEQIDKIEE